MMTRWAMLLQDPCHSATKLSSAISPPSSLPFSAHGKWAGPIGMLQPANRVQRRLILTHATHWTPPLFLHKVIAVRECALQRVAWAPRAQRVRLGNKRAKSVLLRHSQILRLSLCCCGWGLTVMNIGQKLVFHMMIFPNENWWMREGGTRDCVMRGGTAH